MLGIYILQILPVLQVLTNVLRNIIIRGIIEESLGSIFLCFSEEFMEIFLL